MSSEGYKWFKGTRKAIERLPYRLSGTRPDEDPLIARWTQDFHSARGALQLLSEYANESEKAWTKLMESNRDLLIAFSAATKPITPANNRGASEEEVEDGSNGLKEYASVWSHFMETDRGVVARVEVYYKMLKLRINEALECVKTVESLLHKLGRKQLDYERQRAAHKKAVTSQNEAHADSADIELQNAEAIYRDLSKSLKMMIPRFIQAMDNFLTALAGRQLRFNSSLFEFWQSNMQKCASVQNPDEVSTWTDIYEAWIGSFTRIQYQVESIPVLRDGMIIQTPMSSEANNTSVAGHKIKNLANAALGTGEHTATAAYQSIRHMNVPNITFSSTDDGLFGSITSNRVIKPSSERRTEQEIVTAKFDYKGEEGDISFKAGDKIRVIDHGVEDDVNWWCGEFGGKVGLFPRDFVNYSLSDSNTPTPVVGQSANSGSEAHTTVSTNELESEKVAEPASAHAQEETPAAPEPKELQTSAASGAVKETEAEPKLRDLTISDDKKSISVEKDPTKSSSDIKLGKEEWSSTGKAGQSTHVLASKPETSVVGGGSEAEADPKSPSATNSKAGLEHPAVDKVIHNTPAAVVVPDETGILSSPSHNLKSETPVSTQAVKQNEAKSTSDSPSG